MDKLIEKLKLIEKWYFLIIFYVLTVILVLTTVQNLSDTKLQAGDVSLKTYKATKDIENEIATNRNRELAKAEVETIYIVNSDISQEIYKNFNYFYSEMDKVRSLFRAKTIKKEEDNQVVRGFDEQDTQDLKQYLANLDEWAEVKNPNSRKLTIDDIEYIILLPKDDYYIFKTLVEQRIEKLVTEGITNATYESNDFYSSDNLNTSIYEEMLINTVISNLIKPNVSVDVDATESAMEMAVAKVKPVMYLENQTIVEAGEIVTDEQIQVLLKLSLIGGVKDLDVKGVVTYIALLAIVFSIIYIIYSKKTNEKFLTNNYKLMFLLINVNMLVIMYFIPDEYAVLSPIFVLVFLLSSLFNNGIAVIMAIVYTIIYVVMDKLLPAESVYMLIGATFTGMLGAKNLKRFQFIEYSIVISIVSGISYYLMSIIFNINQDLLIDEIYKMLFIIIFVLISIIFANGVIPFFEAMFSLLTSHRLQELASQDRPIFQRMLVETPGTLHHSVVVGNLCEAGAIAIGADSVLAKVYGYYHDIGKLSAPLYFIENQVGYNYHDELEYVDSAKIIKNHVEQGVVIRKQYKLPKFIDEAILAHHGTSVIQYFYRQALNSDTVMYVDIEDYRYDGYIPNSKELTILMIADIVEAGVRSIIPKTKEITEIERFVDKIIDGKIAEGQFANSDLTFSDIVKVKEAFMVVLKGMYHNRITYPAQK